VIRIAAVGDVHFAEDSRGRLAPHWARLAEHADVFALVGDLTNIGSRAQAAALADELRTVRVPIVAVLGNHDFHTEEPDAVRDALEDVGVTVLEGTGVTFRIGERTLGVAGVKGFGGGFPGACGHEFGEPEMKAFVRATELSAAALERALTGLRADFRVALTHYAPVKDTLAGERLEIYPFLGAFQLAEAIDRGGAQLAIHGHAHHGAERGVTPRGVPVRNVAMPLLRRPYGLYCLDAGGEQAVVAEQHARIEAEAWR
jgi:Icc-related predicted phosphoesterase